MNPLFDNDKVGTPEWADIAEKAEWQFVADVLEEAIGLLKENNVVRPSYFSVALRIARQCQKEGWRGKYNESPVS